MPKKATSKEEEKTPEPAEAVEVETTPEPAEVVAPSEEVPAWAKALQSEIAGLRQENEMLKDITGKGAIKSWELEQRDFKNKFAHFKTFNGKVIISWGDLDYSKFDPKAKDARGEKVFTTLHYLDGTSERVNYVDFNGAKELLKVKVTKFGSETTTVEFPPDTVKEYELNKADFTVLNKFLNA